MKISVAIATYNRAPLLRQAVEAALGQSRVPYEVVVSDDASTDGTREELLALAAARGRVRALLQDRNTGGVPNWNAAMAATGGALIAWCSDDDRFLPGHLDAAHAYLDAHPEVGLVHSGFVDSLETSDGGVETAARPLRSARPLLVGRNNLFPYLMRYYDWPFHPSTIVMRRAVWERTGPFDPAYALADTDWFVRAAEQFTAALLPRHGVVNRRHPGNWSNRVGSARMQREIFEIVDRAMARRWPGRSPAGLLWRALWRANVGLRLLLTIRTRLRGGHVNAACAAWQVLISLTGRHSPGFLDRWGQGAIRRWAGRAVPPPRCRESVSPL